MPRAKFIKAPNPSSPLYLEFEINLSCGCLLWYYLLSLLILYPIITHLSKLWHFSSGEVDPQIWIRVPPGGGFLIWYFYLLFIKYHNKLSLHLLKREEIFLLHCVIHCWRDKNVSGWFFSTNLCLDDHHRVVGTCRKKLNMYNCVFWNLIDSFLICLDGGYTCLCICYHVGRAEWE